MNLIIPLEPVRTCATVRLKKKLDELIELVLLDNSKKSYFKELSSTISDGEQQRLTSLVQLFCWTENVMQLNLLIRVGVKMGESNALPELETDRLILLPWKLEYAKDMLIFASNEKVINFAGGWKLITDVQKAKTKIKSYIERDADEWAIALKTNNDYKIIGSIGMHKNSFRNFAMCFDFGYLIAEEFWGQEICAEASKKIMHYAFIGLKCDAMTVSHMLFNKASQRVIEKCKFNFRGVYPKHSQDNPNSKACYFLTRADYIDLYNLSEISSGYTNVNRLTKYNQKQMQQSFKQKDKPSMLKAVLTDLEIQ